MLLYAVMPGDTCIQTTLGLLGEQAYGGEAFAETPVTAVQIPKAMFDRLMADSPVFRTFVFRAFGARMGEVIQVVEMVAFVRIEARLAAALLARADADGRVAATHQDLAVAIGSAREVVSRRLEAFQKAGYVALERGVVKLVDAAGLRQLATMGSDLVTDPAAGL
jgi:CRP/FNR family transcriptional regulator